LSALSIDQLIIHPSVRPQQRRTFDKIQKTWNNYHSFFCSLPTGSGKTDLAACLLSDYLMKNKDDRIDILVPYRMHQDFWHSILQRYGRKHNFTVASLKGRASYYCPIVKAGSNIAPCAFDFKYAQTCESRQNCKLLEARRRIRRSSVRILNWWVFKYVDLQDKATFRIFDEAHNLLNLESLVRLEIASHVITNIARDPRLEVIFQEWQQQLGKQYYFYIQHEEGMHFITQLRESLTKREAEIATQMNYDPLGIDHDLLRELSRVMELISGLSELIENPQHSDLNFFFQRTEKKTDKKVLPRGKLVIQPLDIAYIFTKLPQINVWVTKD